MFFVHILRFHSRSIHRKFYLFVWAIGLAAIDGLYAWEDVEFLRLGHVLMHNQITIIWIREKNAGLNN